MNVAHAATNTILIWFKNEKERSDTLKISPIRDPFGLTLEHQLWLLTEVANSGVLGEKAHRWLSFAQGVLVSRGCVSLEDCKYANVFS
jgi:hypothetical protein